MNTNKHSTEAVVPADDERQREVAAEQTRLLFTHLPLSVVVSLVVAGILGYALLGHVSSMNALGWGAAMLLVCGYRLAIWHLWRSDAPTRDAQERWQPWFLFGAIAVGCAWGSAAVWIFPADSLAHQVFMGFVLASIASGGISTLAVSLKCYLLFLLPTLMPYSIRLFVEGGELQLFMGLVFVLGQVFLLVSARRFEAVTVNALSLKHENARLVGALRSALHDAERANRAKTQFLANMSHEIRTPLSGMMGMSDLLLKSGLSTQQRRLTGTVSQSAAALLSLVEDLLDISQIESGSFALDEGVFDLRACIEDAVDLCAGSGYRKGIEVQLIVENRLPLQALGDARRLRQVLVNLVGNAVAFTKAGQITVRVQCTNSGGRVHHIAFSIADNGIGFARKELELLFEPPVQVRAGGNGLALATTRQLLAMMNGELRLDSEIGRGTTVRFTLPLRATSDGEPALEPEANELAGKRVLVFDDRVLSRESIASRIQCKSARIEFACTEDEALSKLRRAIAEGAPFDLMLVDRVRPRTDSLGLHRKIVSSPDLSVTKVVAMMPMHWTLDEAVAQEFGTGSFIMKPIRRSVLLGAIETTLRSRRVVARTATVRRPAVAVPAQRPVAGNPLAGLKVLVAEDNPVNQEVAISYLEGFGCRTALASNGLEAINAYELDAFDIVLMDCQMPEVDGIAAIRHIRAREKMEGLPRLPIVMVTANAFAADREQALEAGADDFLTKPFSEVQLLKVVESAASRPAA